jgi:hypothetical protein
MTMDDDHDKWTAEDSLRVAEWLRTNGFENLAEAIAAGAAEIHSNGSLTLLRKRTN